jgi:membrane dipeptidase
VLISMEGADCIGDVAELPKWVARGVRVIGPAWGRTRFGGGTGAPGPLTDLGRKLLDQMHRLRVALDLSHQSDEGFWESIERFGGPVCASHSNCRALVPGDRHIDDEMIRAIVARGGVIGVVLYNRYLQPGYELAQGKIVPMSAVVRHIEHICDIAGNTRHVGIGSDLDGGLGVEWTPIGLDSAADLRVVGEALRAAGWSDGDVANVMGENWARWLRTQVL